MDVYKWLGVRRVINAEGTNSYVGGSIMPPDVVDAWVDASRSFVHLDELQAKVSERVAELTGAEAGLITAGADAGLTLATCACMAGADSEKYQQLPDASALKNELILPKICTNIHNIAFQVSGAKLVYVGTQEGFTEEEIDAAVNERTAAVAFVYFTDARRGEGPLKVTIRTAHKHGLPIIVDAAAETPPRENIRALIEWGADVVAYSGGKDIQGPNDTGILYGRAALIEAARVQMRTRTPFGIGRSMKVGREDAVATTYALDRYMKLDMAAHRGAWERRAKNLAEAFKDHPEVQFEMICPDASKGEYVAQGFPRVRMIVDEDALGVSMEKIVQELREGDPGIFIGASGNTVSVNPHCLVDGEEMLIARKLKEGMGL